MPTPVVLGIDYGGSKIAVATADLSGVRLDSVTVAVDATHDAERTFQRGIAAARELLDGRTPLAVGACTFGIPREDGVDLAPTIPGWEQLPFGRELRAAFPASELRLATDVKAAALAETEHGALADCDPGLYLNLGTGLAAALVVGGAVVNGHHGAAGEIGYSLRRPWDGYDTDRLEDAVSGKALALAGTGLGSATVAELLARTPDDARARHAWRDFLAELALHLVNLTIALDPARVVVGGGMVRSWPRIRPTLEAAVAAAVPFPPELVVAKFPFDAPLLGAISIASAAAQDVARSAVSQGASA